MSSLKSKTLVIGVIGADCHAVGNKIITNFLTENNFNVINLGVMVSQDEFVDAAIETGADAILVSSIYGHAEIDCLGFRGRCIERGLKDIVLYLGGNLVVGKRPFAEVEILFTDMGFDRVYAPTADLYAMVRQLHSDVDARESFFSRSKAWARQQPLLRAVSPSAGIGVEAVTA